MSSRPGSFWPDVFVTSRLPWNRFAQSAVCHVAFVVALWGSVRLWPQSPQVLDRPAFNRADVIYYAPSEYLPPLDTGGPRRPLPRKGEPEHSAQPIISVPAEADNRTQTIVTPSDIKLNHDVPLPNIVAWSQNRPSPRCRSHRPQRAANLRMPALPVTAVAPAPETMPANRPAVAHAFAERGRAGARAERRIVPDSAGPAGRDRPTSAQRGCCFAAPSGRHQHRTLLRWLRPRRNCPWPSNTQHAGRAQAALGGGAGSAAVAAAAFDSGKCRFECEWQDDLAGHSSCGHEPGGMPAGNRRGTFAATPAGKTGAPGTPDIAASANHGSGSRSRQEQRRHPLRTDRRRGPRQSEPLGGGRAGKRNGSGSSAGPRAPTTPD